MIKIVDQDIAAVERREVCDPALREAFCLRFSEEHTDAEKYSFVVRDGSAVMGAASFENLRRGRISGQVFRRDHNFFEEARDYVYASGAEEGDLYAVIDETGGECCFLLTYVENRIIQFRSSEGYLWNTFSTYDFDNPYLDFTLLDQRPAYIFYELEEYTYALTKLIRRRSPERPIYYLDNRPCVKRLLEGERVSYIETFYDYHEPYRPLIITSSRGNCTGRLPENWHSVYNSQNVMYSLLWTVNRESFGEENPDDVIFVMDYAVTGGLVEAVNMTHGYVRVCRERGWIPVVDLNCFPNPYLEEGEGENMWDYYFERVSPITPEEAYRSKHVIRASANGIRCNEFEINPYVREYALGLGWRADMREISKLNKGTEERIGQILPREFQSGKKIMGVVARGSGARDEVSEAVKRNYRMENIAIVPYIERCEKVMKEEGMDYIFLATEDAEYFQLFQQAFGEKLIFVDQPRIAWEPYIKEVRGGNIKPLGHYLGTGRAVGERYLAVVRGLSMCDMLATNNMACGAFNLARNWNHGKYRRIDTFG